MTPCVIFEDEHLLVVHKPAGWNTHAPSPFAGEGIYDWLKNREPRWSSLAILHRLDKETSGVLVFGKTPLANRSLTEQFTERRVHKKYLLLTDRAVPIKEFTVKTALVRVGEKYMSRPPHAGAETAETRFGVPPSGGSAMRESSGRLKAELQTVEAEPLTGRTHQIRVHAAESGFPILGDTLYGGTPAARVFLHAAEISFAHPATGEPVTFSAPANFDADAPAGGASVLASRSLQSNASGSSAASPHLYDSRLALRTAIIEPDVTDTFRVIHGASDGWPGWFVEKLGDFLLSQSEQPLSAKQNEELLRLAKIFTVRGAYHKILSRQVRRSTTTEASPQLVFGEVAPERFEILENGVRFEMSFNEGYSVGLFLDQRDNRRRFLTGHVAADFPLFKSEIGNRKSEILNAFAYTCGFSVCAARAGARTTSLDLSKKYLEWGRRNFALNGLDPAAHDFIYGDTFDWLRRLAKKGRAFDAVVLDPPTFSQSKEHGTFRAEKDYGRLVTAALPVLKPGGILFASKNAADWPPENFLADVDAAVHGAKRKILQRHYVPQPPDFPISRAEPAYLKTVWLKIG
ncbi:MAG TPA: pseudouridine synthase [Candidatus Limnocylindrales bacterium]|nr:pseudouridine synthase [Candidatus Limnocylindrales bacterium]